jgi:hypothetical protein
MRRTAGLAYRMRAPSVTTTPCWACSVSSWKRAASLPASRSAVQRRQPNTAPMMARSKVASTRLPESLLAVDDQRQLAQAQRHQQRPARRTPAPVCHSQRVASAPTVSSTPILNSAQ